MSRYDAEHFQPPAPIAEVRVRTAKSGDAEAVVTMLIDTGADCSLLPKRVAEEIGLQIDRNRTYRLSGYDGSTRDTSTVIAQVIFCRKAFQGRYALTDDPMGILGRDVLNHLRLLLDGPEKSWSQA